MGLFNNNNGVVLTPRQQLESKVQTAKTDLLLIVIMTVVNIVLLVTGSNTYFIFSAYIPYVTATLGMSLCGKFPAEFYEGDLSEYAFFGEGVFVGFIAAAVVLTLLYLLCWFLSKPGKSGWLIFALVMISIDTAFLLSGGIAADMIIDLLFHIWMIITISMGISANKKLKALPEELPFTDEPLEPIEETAPEASEPENTEE